MLYYDALYYSTITYNNTYLATRKTTRQAGLSQGTSAHQSIRGGRVLLTEIPLPRTARQGTAYSISKRG